MKIIGLIWLLVPVFGMVLGAYTRDYEYVLLHGVLFVAMILLNKGGGEE